MERWIAWWFPPLSPHVLSACMRIGVGMLLLYSFYVHALDLHIPPLLDPSSSSLFRWFGSPSWRWSVQIFAFLAALMMVLGVYPLVVIPLCLLLLWQQMTHQSAMITSLDQLLCIALIYLSFLPCGRTLSILPAAWYGPWRSHFEQNVSTAEAPHKNWGAWHGCVWRLLQVHLCWIYLSSALTHMDGDWLSGFLLWYPLLQERSANWGAVLSAWFPASLWFVRGVWLLELLYGILIWVPGLRWGILFMMCIAHFVVGWGWSVLPYNLLMISLNLVFLPVASLERWNVRLFPEFSLRR